ncbi:MAG: N-formylglutamate amidohydrolase [Phycisphaeraceae bacterium]|nr:N-formylglutamate amidohydrolase [Phycisphaeraceae bacterium]
MKSRTEAVIITCEHGGNRIPPRYRMLFDRGHAALNSHRGWDPGALQLARQLAAAFDAPLHFSTVSRLLVDLNRSERHPRVFSRYTRALPELERERVLKEHYRPYREAVLQRIEGPVSGKNRVVHISVHSFTPVLKGVRRTADIGLLYDPRRPSERALAAAWQHAIRSVQPGLKVRLNYPYLGTSDGHTTSLRGRFQADLYVGIEVEVNQSLVRAGGDRWAAVRRVLVQSLAVALGAEGAAGRGGRAVGPDRKRSLRP